jgi:sulfite exporter TauE/SafE
MNAALLASAWLMGFLGSTHCIAMCGGVVAVACSALPLRKRPSVAAQLPYVLAYNGGRILSYAAAGALAGAIGAALASVTPVAKAQIGLRLVADAMMIAVGAYVAGLSRVFRWIEGLGEPLWRRVAPLGRALVPVRSLPGAFALGLVWGWLPCGLVYAGLAAAVTSGSALGGAATMAAFGAGTLPMLLALGSAASFVARAARRRWVRSAAGATMIAFGVVQMAHTGHAWASVENGRTPACCPGHRHAAGL